MHLPYPPPHSPHPPLPPPHLPPPIFLPPPDFPPPPPSPPDSVNRLEIDIVGAAAGISLSLLLVQVLHWRPSSLLTHGGASMLLGIGLNFSYWLTSLVLQQPPQVISIVVSPAAHDWVYFGLLPPIIFEAGFSMRKRGFFYNIVPILLYAVAGTLIATFAAGAMIFSLGNCGLISHR